MIRVASRSPQRPSLAALSSFSISAGVRYSRLRLSVLATRPGATTCRFSLRGSTSPVSSQGGSCGRRSKWTGTWARSPAVKSSSLISTRTQCFCNLSAANLASTGACLQNPRRTSAFERITASTRTSLHVRNCRTHAPLQTAPLFITSLARTSSAVGNVIPSVRAVFMLMNSSAFVACRTGRFSGLSPRRIRPVYKPP
jgi:hypothetical protein